MKTFKKSYVLLAGAMLTALTGCGGDSAGDFTPEEKPNASAPTHGGDIMLNFNEKDALTFVNLLGTPNGTATGEGVAADADGNYLTITDISITTSGPRVDDILGAGIEINGNQIGVRPLAVAPNLDTDETHTAVVSFNISDGANKTPRTATFVFEGEDFAPVIANDLIANFTRDAGSSSIDGLTDVTDADEEALTISNLVADAGNPFTLPVTINGTNIEIDVSAVENQIPDGQKVTFDFTYTVSDHRFDLERNLTLNVLGVQDIPGAPLVLNYFLSEDVLETDGMLVVDLAKEIDEREGDAIVISDIALDGEEYTSSFAGEVDANTLYFNPNAYFDEIAAGEFRDFRFTMKVSDDQGNTSDGERELIIRVNGVESNLLVANGMDVGFENGGTGFDLTWCDPGAGIQSSIVANGDASFQMLGAPCYYAVTAEAFPDLEVGGKYYFHYNAYVGNGDASPYIMLSADPNGAHNFWAGARPWHPANASWRPLLVEFDTQSGYLATANDDGETPMDIAAQLRLFVMSAWLGNDGMPVLDDFTFVRFDNLEGVDILTNSPGSFEDTDYVPMTTGGGIVEVREDPNDSTNNVLFVDTTGATEAITISFPIDNGAMVSGGRYRVTYDVQYLNYTANNEAGSDPNINEFGGYQFEIVFKNPDIELDFTLFSNIWNGADYGQVQNIADETSHWWGFGADTDWNSENNTVNFVLKGVGAQYIIDNIEIIRVP
ncbi:MAG: hypothetical protein Alis3KO_28670 [Aliiglaciecola sp.]